MPGEQDLDGATVVVVEVVVVVARGLGAGTTADEPHWLGFSEHGIQPPPYDQNPPEHEVPCPGI